MAELRVGIVGAPRGSGFSRAFQTIRETQLVALCDSNPETLERVADRLGVARRYREYAAMVESDLDLIVVATPMPLHVPQAVAALRAGKHVLSEVPAATDLLQCWELVQAVRQSGRKYMMAENYTYIKPNVLIRELARRGLFGEVYFGEGEYVHELKALNEQTPWRRKWQTGRNGCTYPTHSLGPLLQWFQDRVATVACFGSGHHYRDPRGDPYENEDTTFMICKLSRGGLVNIRLDMLSNRPHMMTYYSLQGTRGCYEAPRAPGETPRIWLADHCDDPNRWRPLADFEAEYLPDLWRNPPQEAREAGHGGGDYFEVREFVDCILQDTRPPIDLYDALDMTVPGLVSEESIRQGGRPLPVPDFRAIRRFPEDLPAELRDSPILRVEW